MRRQETTAEKLWRYRGVLLVASIPVLLIISVITFMPRSSQFQPAAPVQITPQTAPVTSSDSKQDGTSFKYSVVFDAGSTGSRVHVFKFKVTDTGLELLSDTFEQLKPGLSSYADEPQKAAESLKPLMTTAIATVPKDQQASTSVTLRATAGLRLLPGDKADKILGEVTAYLKQQPFLVKDDAVSILGGQDEGAYAWLTLNYLLGKLGGDISNSVAAIDLGGGSVQEAFAVSDSDAASAPKGYVVKLRGGGKPYNVYVHSYLGYGLMAARAKVIESAPKDAPHCFPKEHTGTYTYGGKTYEVTKVTEPGSFETCSKTAASAMASGQDCGAPKDQCSFSGAWRGKGPGGERVYYVSSYFWDRAVDSGIISDAAAISWKTSPKDFAAKGAAACGKEVKVLSQEFKLVREEHAPYFCLDLSYCYTVLTKGFKLEESVSITLVKQVEYNGQKIEAAWPLGAAINELS